MIFRNWHNLAHCGSLSYSSCLDGIEEDEWSPTGVFARIDLCEGPSVRVESRIERGFLLEWGGFGTTVQSLVLELEE
jgi:hypothetical protein